MDGCNLYESNQQDVIEESILSVDRSILSILLQDKSSKRNIIWATRDYEDNGPLYSENSEILPGLITGVHTFVIQPRSSKAKNEQTSRTRSKAEVFTPSWVCNKQNNLIDEQWFGRQEVFNREIFEGWISNADKIEFPSQKRSWKKYVDAQRLEVSCGEAPYLVSRYDTVTGNSISLFDRIGFFDRKMRVVEENATSDEWVFWSIRALQSIYGYEYQGDNLLLARENLLLSYIEYYKHKFQIMPPKNILHRIANVIAWNIWQMDGLRFVIPNSCHCVEVGQISMFDNSVQVEPCPGCRTGNCLQHNGRYCIVQDWRTKAPVRYVDMIKERV